VTSSGWSSVVTGATAWSAGEPPGLVASGVTGPKQTVARYVERTVDGFDAYQQRHGFTAVPCAIIRKYSDDRAGRLAGQISHAAFLAVFPMVLVLLTLVGVVLDGHTAVQNDIINSALRQFPVLGSDLRNNVHQLSTANTLALIIGLVWLLYGSMRLSRSSQVMMAVVWDIDRDELPNFWRWLPRAAGFLVVLGVGFLAGGALVGLGAFGRFGSFSAWIGLLLSLVVNVLMYWGAFIVLVRIPRKERAVWPGAVIGGLGWTVLQFVGAQLVTHQLRHLSNLYGTFATILGLIWWIALGSMITVFAAEANVVLTRRLWPRSIRRIRTPRPDLDPTGPQPPSHPKPTAPTPTIEPAPTAAPTPTTDPDPTPAVRGR
jgi:YihY family inner membrane protein